MEKRKCHCTTEIAAVSLLVTASLLAQVVEPPGTPVIGLGIAEAMGQEPAPRVIITFAVPQGLELASERGRAVVGERADAILDQIPAGQFTLQRRFQSINAVAGELTAAGLDALLATVPGVLRIDLDLGGSGELAQAVPMVNLDDLQLAGFTGSGVTVAVLDSGIDTDHVDLTDDLVAQACFCSGGGGCCPNGSSTQTGMGAAEDDNGHGTNVTGIVTSKGTVAPIGGAPDSDIVAVKVLDSNNSFCCSSDVIAGLDWIFTNLATTPVDVVNMSLGTFALFTGTCDAVQTSYATAVDNLRQAGVTVFVSSGNQASGTSMGAPACIANSLAVGAVWDSDVGSKTVLGCTDATTAADQVTCFSNSNSTTDLFAPGAPTTSTGLNGGTSTYFGTSQASPLSAACAAALRQRDPSVSPSWIESALESSSISVTDVTNGLSFPRLDCQAAFDNVCIDDAFELVGSGSSNDSCNGGSIGLGVAQSHAHCDEDWAFLSATAGGTYVIETSNLVGGADTTLAVHLGCGAEILFDDDGGLGLGSRIEFTSTADQDADLRIRELGDQYARGEAYDLTVSCTTLALQSRTVANAQSFSCGTISAENGVTVENGGDLRLDATMIKFGPGFSVASGGSLSATTVP